MINTCGKCLFWKLAAAENPDAKTAVCPIVKGRKHKLAKACDGFQEPEKQECQCCGSEYCSCTDCIKAGKDTCCKENKE